MVEIMHYQAQWFLSQKPVTLESMFGSKEKLLLCWYLKKN